MRPVLYGELFAADGSWQVTEFLLDTGADRTVLKASMLQKLSLPLLEPEDDISGLGGVTGSVLIETKLNLPRDDGVLIIFTSSFTAVTDPGALDLCVLGRDILDLFSVIIDRPCLLSQKHHYTVIQEA